MLVSPPNRGRTQISRPRKRVPFPSVEVTDTKIMWTLFRDQILCLHLTGGDDISNDVITLGTCFSMFFYTRTRFRFTLIGGNLTAQLTGSHRGIGSGIQIPDT